MPFAVDSGRAWLVLSAAVLSAALTVGNALSLGTLSDYVDKQMHGSAATISFLFALTVSLNFFVGCVRKIRYTGAFAGPVTELIGYRSTIAVGAAFAMAGYGLSVFATHVWHLYLTIGLLLGVGYGLVFSPSVGILSHYFKRYFHFAGAVSTTGIPVGVMVFSKLHPLLLEQLQWTRAMLSEAALCSLLFIGVFVIAEPQKITIEKTVDSFEFIEKKFPTDESMLSAHEDSIVDQTLLNNAEVRAVDAARVRRSSTSSVRNALHCEREFSGIASEQNKAGARQLLPPLLDINSKSGARPVSPTSPSVFTVLKSGLCVDLFRKSEFYLLMLSGLAILGADIFVVMTPKYLVDSHGWNPSMTTVSLVLVTFGATSLTVRILLNTLNAYPKWADRLSKPLQVAFGVLCIAAASFAYLFSPTVPAPVGVVEDRSWFIFPDENNVELFFIFAAVCGVGEAFFACYQVSLLEEILGKERLTASFGYLSCAWGIGTIACYPIAGIMGDKFGTMRYAFAVGIASCCVSFVALLVVVVKTKKTNAMATRQVKI